MLHLNTTNIPELRPESVDQIFGSAPDMTRVHALTETDRVEMLRFLAERPVHTVVMTSFIIDNGVVSDLNRGRFFAYRNAANDIEGVALIGHSTLVEARSNEALKALAVAARSSETPIHLVMSSGTAAEDFWQHMTDGLTSPRLTCIENLFEVKFPFSVQNSEWKIQHADNSHLNVVAAAQAEVAFMECGVDPLVRDRESFLKRVARRIEKNRVYVALDGDEVIFKATIVAETDSVAYLEGIWVHPEYRGRGIGSKCLSAVALDLLSRVEHICLLSNVEFVGAHKSFQKAGFRHTDECVTLFV